MNSILIADDDATIRTICASIVASEGYLPIQASNGKLAWDILADNPSIKLAIIDMVMPEMSGQDLVKALRETTQFKNLPIIMISGIVPMREISSILELGASRFIAKPVNTEHLREYIRLLIKQSSR